MLNRKTLVSALLAAGLMVSGTASAEGLEDESNMYYGIALGEGQADGYDADDRADSPYPDALNQSRMPGFSVNLGYEVSSALSFEGRFIRQKHDIVANMANVYARVAYPTARTKTYLMLGGGVAQVYGDGPGGDRVNLDDITNSSGEELFEEPSAAAVVGIELFGNDRTSLTFEYMANFSSDVRIDMYALGYRHYFGGYQ